MKVWKLAFEPEKSADWYEDLGSLEYCEGLRERMLASMTFGRYVAKNGLIAGIEAHIWNYLLAHGMNMKQ
jgi:hypothetical protein